MMKKLLLTFGIALYFAKSFATIHTFQVWDGYFKFIQSSETIYLGDTIQWLPVGGGAPNMSHTITSESIPEGALEFDVPWEAPADTFFQYIPEVAGTYDYVCTPHKTSHNMVGSFVVESVLGTIDLAIEEKALIHPNPAQIEINISEVLVGSEYIVYGHRIICIGAVNRQFFSHCL